MQSWPLQEHQFQHRLHSQFIVLGMQKKKIFIAGTENFLVGLSVTTCLPWTRSAADLNFGSSSGHMKDCNVVKKKWSGLEQRMGLWKAHSSPECICRYSQNSLKLVNPEQKPFMDLLHLKSEYCVGLNMHIEQLDREKDPNRSKYLRCNKHPNLCW